MLHSWNERQQRIESYLFIRYWYHIWKQFNIVHAQSILIINTVSSLWCYQKRWKKWTSDQLLKTNRTHCGKNEYNNSSVSSSKAVSVSSFKVSRSWVLLLGKQCPDTVTMETHTPHGEVAIKWHIIMLPVIPKHDQQYHQLQSQLLYIVSIPKHR